jgi:hypothetical protein
MSRLAGLASLMTMCSIGWVLPSCVLDFGDLSGGERDAGAAGAEAGTDADATPADGQEAAPGFRIGGQVNGLAGTGLVLRNNGTDDLPIPKSGQFTFDTPVPDGWAYQVSVASQPTEPSQTCVVSNGMGTVQGADVQDVSVSCSVLEYAVRGTVSGVVGSGLTLKLNDSGPISVTQNGPFAFPTPIRSGDTYLVTVASTPTNPDQTCSVAGGNGVMGHQDVNDVLVSCSTSAYSVGGTVSGLTGQGLRLLNNGGDELTVAQSGAFEFPALVPSGGAYSVTVSQQPSLPEQICSVAGGQGTVSDANVTSVSITCTGLSFTGSGPGGTIYDGPDPCGSQYGGQPIESAIVVPTSFSVGSVTVTLEGLQHTFSGDVWFTLTHGETSIRLLRGIGSVGSFCANSCEADFSGDYRLGDAFVQAMDPFCLSPFLPPGDYHAMDQGAFVALDAPYPQGFRGMDAAGAWVLRVQDVAVGDYGSLNGWRLQLSAQ